MKLLGVIPARFGSTRFPGKPLAMIGGKTMIHRTYERAVGSSLDAVVVATDDQRIFDEIRGFGGDAVMTRPTIGVAQTGAAKHSTWLAMVSML